MSTHRLIKIYEKGEDGQRTLRYVGRTAKTLEAYEEVIRKYEEKESSYKTKIQTYMYEKGLDKFVMEMCGGSYETRKEAEIEKMRIQAEEKPTFDATMNYNRARAPQETDSAEDGEHQKRRFVRVGEKLIPVRESTMDPVDKLMREIEIGERARKQLELLAKRGEELRAKMSNNNEK